MKYALVIHEMPEEMAKRNGPGAPAYWAAWSAYWDAIKAAGVDGGGGAGLQGPETATTVRVGKSAGAKHSVQDGPFADTKEQLGGFFVVDVPDLDEAIKWAARAPTPGGCVEVRPLLSM